MNRAWAAGITAVLLATAVAWGAGRGPAGQGKKETPTAVPKEVAEYRELHEKIHKIRVTFAFDEKLFEAAAGLLAEKSGIKIAADAGILPDPEQTLTLKLTDVPLDTALDFFAERYGVEWEVRKDGVFLSREGEMRPARITATYDVRDLMYTGKPTTKTRDGEEETVTPGEELEKLMELIRSNVAPGTWDEELGNTISGRQAEGCIVVAHSIGVQDKVLGLLEMLRKARDLGAGDAPKK